jgi:hypothetical protein
MIHDRIIFLKSAQGSFKYVLKPPLTQKQKTQFPLIMSRKLLANNLGNQVFLALASPAPKLQLLKIPVVSDRLLQPIQSLGDRHRAQLSICPSPDAQAIGLHLLSP